MARNEDMGWGRYDNVNQPPPAPRVTMLPPPSGTAKPRKQSLKKTTKKPSAAVGNPYETLRGNLQAGLNQAQQGAFARGPAGYAQAGAMADRVHNMLSYDMPQQSNTPKRQPSQFGQRLGHALISTAQFGRAVYLGYKGRGPGQPNERRKPTVPFAGNSRSGTTRPLDRRSAYGVVNDMSY